jgi:hypothetical protein
VISGFFKNEKFLIFPGFNGASRAIVENTGPHIHSIENLQKRP